MDFYVGTNRRNQKVLMLDGKQVAFMSACLTAMQVQSTVDSLDFLHNDFMCPFVWVHGIAGHSKIPHWYVQCYEHQAFPMNDYAGFIELVELYAKFFIQCMDNTVNYSPRDGKFRIRCETDHAVLLEVMQ